LLPTITPSNVRRIIIFCVAVLTLYLISVVSLKHTAGDFDVYYYSSQSYLDKMPVYIPHGGINEFKYSPLFALLFSPLALMKRTPALYVWTVFNILYFYAIFFIFYKLKQLSFTSRKDLLILVLLFALTGRYILSDFKLGQVNVFLCFLMLLVMYLEVKNRHFLASVVLAFSLMIKFFPLLFVFYFLLRRRFKLVVYTFLMVIVFLLLPAVYSGWSLNLKYLHDWLGLLRSTPAVLLYSPKNNSLLSYFSWIFVAGREVHSIFDYILIKTALSAKVYYAWGASCFVLFASFFYDTLFVKDKDPRGCYLDYSCLFVCGLLFNPLAYLNALTFLIIPYFFILRYLFYSRVNMKFILAVVFLISLSFILMIINNRVFFKDPDQFYAFLELKPLMWSMILVYISLWLAKFSLKVRP